MENNRFFYTFNKFLGSHRWHHGTGVRIEIVLKTQLLRTEENKTEPGKDRTFVVRRTEEYRQHLS